MSKAAPAPLPKNFPYFTKPFTIIPFTMKIRHLLLLAPLLLVPIGANAEEEEVTYSVALVQKAEAGDVTAQFDLACCYEFGEGTAADAAKAAVWYRKAADQGHSEAECRLGLLYAKGEGVEKNIPEAIKWYAKSIKQGFNMAVEPLGELAEEGNADAFHALLAAAEAGQVDAQFVVGTCYEGGHGVQKDASEAMKWYAKAAAQGDELAAEAIAEINGKEPERTTAAEEGSDDDEDEDDIADDDDAEGGEAKG